MIENNIFNEGDRLRRGLIDVHKTYEQVRSISQQKNNFDQNKIIQQQPSKGFEKDKKWNDVMHFLENNPNVLVEMMQNEGDNSNITTENNRQGIINYRNITGIAAPGRRGK